MPFNKTKVLKFEVWRSKGLIFVPPSDLKCHSYLAHAFSIIWHETPIGKCQLGKCLGKCQKDILNSSPSLFPILPDLTQYGQTRFRSFFAIVSNMVFSNYGVIQYLKRSLQKFVWLFLSFSKGFWAPLIQHWADCFGPQICFRPCKNTNFLFCLIAKKCQGRQST